MSRAVIDTNVLVSGVLSDDGFPAVIMRAIRAGEIELVISRWLIAEFEDVITRPHIARKYSLAGRLPDLLRFFERQAVEVPSVEPMIAGDPKDDHVLACANAGNAEFIVSGDHHLLEFEAASLRFRILTPRRFVEEVLDR